MSKISFPGGGSAGGGAGVSDHGGLAGLGDDDHSQYLIGDYSRSSDQVYASSGHFVSGLAVGASGRISLNDYAFIVETAGISGFAVRRSDGRVGINSPATFTSQLTIGGDPAIISFPSGGKLDAAGNLTFEDGGAGAFTNFVSTSMRMNGDNGGAWNVTTSTTTKDTVALQAMAGQTANMLVCQNVAGDPNAIITSGGLIGASGGIVVNDHILPSASGTVSLGISSQPFASGIFNNGFWIRGQDDGQSPGFDRNGWNIRTIAMNGSLTNLESNSVILNTVGSLLWGATQGGFTSPADGEVVLKNAAGTASGHFIAASGSFASGINIRAPNGSGWTLVTDNAGGLTTNGPFVW
jgi:hypothetical protein